jgi:hypothetical protein
VSRSASAKQFSGGTGVSNQACYFSILFRTQ